MSVAGDQNIVLDPYAAPAGDINARLDGHNHAGLQHGLIFHGKPGRLVDQQAHAVPQSMAEAAAVTGFGDNAAGNGIDVVAHCARPDGIDGLGFVRAGPRP